MELVEKVLGSASDPVWSERLTHAEVDWLELGQWDAQKNRLRKETEGGRPVAIALERGERLKDGDVLCWDDTARKAVVCRIRLCPVMAVDLTGLKGKPLDEALATAVRLGHALGNQHWPAVVREGRVYVPMTAGRKVMDAVMQAHALDGVSTVFLSGEDVRDLLDTQEARRLFGGAEMPGHHHEHEHSHAGYGHDNTRCTGHEGSSSVHV